MLKAIDQAKERVEFLTFIFWTGNIAHKFAHALASKAEEGVEVFVILDSFGAADMPEELYELMKKKGVQVEFFRPLTRWKFWKLDNRTHRKVLICDGEVAFTGGVGIAGEWEGDARNENEWRDTHFLIKGPAVFGLQAAFMENWTEAGRSLKFDHTIKAGADPDQKVAVQVIRLCCVGSANFNHRSMLKDDEINVVILDEKVTGELNDHFEDDLKHCEKVETGQWKKRSLLNRATEKITHLLDDQI